MQRIWTRLVALACSVVFACAPSSRDAQSQTGGESPYVLVFAGDKDEVESDFLAVIDLRLTSPDLGRAIATMPIGMTSSMPHHMEYVLPPAGEFLFMNAHHHEMSFLVDVTNARVPKLTKTLTPPAPLRFPHDYSRTS